MTRMRVKTARLTINRALDRLDPGGIVDVVEEDPPAADTAAASVRIKWGGTLPVDPAAGPPVELRTDDPAGTRIEGAGNEPSGDESPDGGE